MITPDITTLPLKGTLVGTDRIIIVDSEDTDRMKAAYVPLGGGGGTSVTVTDSATIDFTLTAQNITGSVKTASIGTSHLTFVPALSGDLTAHTNDMNNPHSVTKTQVGLSDVPNIDATNRGNHTGAQLASTISDFAEVVRDTMGTALVAGANITITPNDGADTITIAATGGGGASANLSTIYTATNITVASDSGTDAVLVASDGTNAGLLLPAEKTKLTGIATGATANSSDATLLSRTNHTGTQTADTLTDGTTNKVFLATERTKLTGIATGATANSSDATLLNRANHTGTQLAATISDFATAADLRVQQPVGIQTPSYTASYTPAPTAAQPAIKMTLTGNITVNAIASPTTGMVVTFVFYQDATGGRTITWNSVYKNPPTTVTTASGITVASFIYDGTNWV